MTPKEIEIAFSQAIADAGLGDTLIPADGKLHRFKVPADKGRQRTGWAVLHADLLPVGVAGDWRTGEEIWWKAAGKAVELSKADRRKVEALRCKREVALEDAQQRAASKAAALYERLPAASADHPYLARKKIPAGLCKVTTGGALVVSVHDVRSNEIISLQFIRSDGEKRFLTGGRTAGGCCFLGAHDSKPVVICEGYATGQAIQESVGSQVSVAVAFNCGNLLSIARLLRVHLSDREIIIAADNDTETAGNPGVTKATEAAVAIGARLVVMDGPGDFNDLYVAHGAEAVKAMFMPIAGQSDTPKGPDNVVERLAQLPAMKYDQRRKAEAKRLGVRLGTLDDAVKAAQAGEDKAQFKLPEPGPWSEKVDGDALLDELETAFRQYIVMELPGLQTLALWAVHTYCFERWQNTPRLHIRSPKKRSGKSRVLDVLDCIVAQPIRADGLTPAVVFRLTEDRQPTWLVDETDQWLDMKGELVGIFNSGHARGQKVYRCVGDAHQVQEFNVYAPLALAGIGKIKSDTLADRSIALSIRRKLRSEPITRFHRDLADKQFEPLRRQIQRWVNDTTFGDPEIPAEVDHDRMVDNWWSLLAIADAAGGDWPERAREIMLQQYWAYDSAEDGGWDILLLQDLKDIFNELGQDRIFTNEILNRLHRMTERQWLEYPNWKTGDTKPMTSNQLAYLLKPHEIRSRQMKKAGVNKHGYERSDFEDTWNRYLTSSTPSDTIYQSATPLPFAENKGFQGSDQGSGLASPTATATPSATAKPKNSAKGSGVAGETPLNAGNGTESDAEDIERQHDQ